MDSLTITCLDYPGKFFFKKKTTILDKHSINTKTSPFFWDYMN